MPKKAHLCLLMLVVFMLVGTVPIEYSGGAFEYSSTDVDYPRGYTHRPFIAFYTSLSCPPCMGSAEPAHTSYWEKSGYEAGQPVTTVVFHLRAGGDRDDILYHEDASAWANHQNVIGTPSIFIDDGYYSADSSETDISAGVDASGSRHGTTGFGVVQGDTFKNAELEVYYLPGETEFRIRAVVRYIESQGGPPGPRGNVVLNGFLNLFMVEDMIDAYSSDLGENVTCHNAFRGFAALKEPVVLDEGGEWSGEFSWVIPKLSIGDDQMPISPANLFPVAVLYDSEDTMSGGASGWPGATRSINSATAVSTAYDIKAESMDIPSAEAVAGSDSTQVTLDFGDEEVSGAVIVYNTHSEDYNGTWSFLELSDAGDGKWTGEIGHAGTIYYSIRVYDENWVETRTEVSELMQTTGSSLGDRAGMGWFIPLVVLVLVIAAAVYLLRPEIVKSTISSIKGGGSDGEGNAASGGETSLENEEAEGALQSETPVSEDVST